MSSHTAPSTPLALSTEGIATIPKASISDRASQTTPAALSASIPSPTSLSVNTNSQITMEGPMTPAAIDLESYLHQTLNLCNKLAKTNLDDPALTAPESQGSVMGLGSEVAAAKMLNYCIRMLHADGWVRPTPQKARMIVDSVTQHPPTVIRAMVLRESGLEAGMKTTLYKALRERREEIKVGEAKRAGIVDNGVEAIDDKVSKKTGSKGVGRRNTLPGRGRKSRAMIANDVNAKNTMAAGTMHQVGFEDGRNSPPVNLI